MCSLCFMFWILLVFLWAESLLDKIPFWCFGVFQNPTLCSSTVDLSVASLFIMCWKYSTDWMWVCLQCMSHQLQNIHVYNYTWLCIKCNPRKEKWNCMEKKHFKRLCLYKIRLGLKTFLSGLWNIVWHWAMFLCWPRTLIWQFLLHTKNYTVVYKKFKKRPALRDFIIKFIISNCFQCQIAVFGLKYFLLIV